MNHSLEQPRDMPRSIVMLGLGAEASGAFKYFGGRSEIFVFDDDPAKCRAFQDAGARTLNSVTDLNSHAMKSSDDEVWLRAPSLSPKHPAIAVGSSHRKLITTYTSLWIARHRSSVLATITGTKGKSTSTALCGAILNAAHFDVVVGGNIGIVPDSPPRHSWLFETSSFQLYDCLAAAPAHAITSIYAEHLDWHGDMNAYIAAKVRPYDLDKTCVAVVPDALSDLLRGKTNPRVIVEEVARWTEGGLSLRWDGSQALVPLRNFDRLSNPTLQHNFAIACVVALVSARLDLEVCADAAALAFNTWSGLPSRQEVIGRYAGRTWVDDALATIPQATVAALDRWKGSTVRLIIGGKERQQDFFLLASYLDEHAEVHVYTYGEAAERLNIMLKRRSNVATSFGDALTRAFEESSPSDVILFSPAGATPERGESYKSRSEKFRQFAHSRAES